MISVIKIRATILFLCILSNYWTFGQYGTKFEVIPPSPNASSLGKFGEVPVSLFTGIPQINVPIHSYKGLSNGLSLNISLNYHAGGVKVSEVASNVGQSWALNAGGVISRTIYGLADFNPLTAGFNMPDTLPNGTGQINRIKGCIEWAGLGSAADPSNNMSCNGQPGCIENVADFYKIVNINKGDLDGQFDVFNYSFQGYSGKFIIGKNDSILQMPQTDLKISRIPGINIQGFVVTTPEGVQYVFKEWEYNNYITRRCPYGAPDPLGCPQVGFNQDISSWYLSEIYSASKKDTIKFTYEGAVLRYESDMGETYYLGSTGTPVFAKVTCYNGDIGGFVPNEKRVTNIEFPDNTSISFHYDSDITRNDMKINGSARALKKIILNGADFSYEYQLYHSYFSTSGTRLAYNASHPQDDYNYRLALDSIKRKSGSLIEPFYAFSYNNDITGNVVPGRFSNAQDHWGFYNGATSNISLIPAPTNMTADRTANSNVSKSGTLTKIIYPTGGSTTFEFEGNQSTTGAIGGIRILKTIDFDGISHINDITTEYSYSESSSSQPVYNYNLFLRIPNNLDQIYNVYSSFSNRTLGQYRGSPATYQTVTVSKTKGSTKLGKTIYSFSNGGRLLYNGGFDPDYSKGYPYVPIQYLDWADGLPASEKYFDDQNNPVKEVIYDYDISNIKVKSPFFKALKVATLAGPYECNQPTFCNSDCSISVIPNGAGGHDVERDYIIYTSVNYYPYTGKAQLLKKIEKDYDIYGNVAVKETDYTYHATYQLVTQQTVNNSKGEELKTTFKYPFDFLSTPVYQRMTDQNIISPIIEQRSFNNNTQLTFSRKNYFEFNSDLFVTQSIEQQNRDNPIEPVVQFTKFDVKGNLLQSQKADDIKISYQWGYNGQYPIVSIKNAQYIDGIYNDQQINSSLTITSGQNQAQTTFTAHDGTIQLTLDAHPGKTYSLDFSLVGPEIRSGTLCVSSSSTPCQSNHYSTLTFNNMPAGAYTLYLYYYGSDPDVFRRVSYNYLQRTVITPEGKEFFYEGFEVTGDGSATPFVGKKYKTGDYTVPFTIPNGRSYQVNYRYLDGSVWKSISKAYTSNMTLDEGTAIDEVRVYPVDALMSTYTYKPLIGMTSQTDPSGRTILYEYDSFGRLKLIRDQDKNVIKTIDYQLQQSNNQ